MQPKYVEFNLNQVGAFSEKHKHNDFEETGTRGTLVDWNAIYVVLVTPNKMPRAFKICPELIDRSCFYRMKAVINFLRLGDGAPPYPPGWGCAPDPAFLQWHRELNGLTVYKIKN